MTTGTAARADAASLLLAELAWLGPVLRREVRRLRRARLLHEDELRGLYIPDPLVDAVLDDLGGEPEEAGSIAARAVRDPQTPIGRLARRFALSAAETDVLMVAVAPQVDARWQTVYGFVQNSVTLRRPTVDLILRLLVPEAAERLACRRWFHPSGPLVRHALVRLVAEPGDPAPSLSSRTLAVDDRVIAHLLGDDTIAPGLSSWVAMHPPRDLDELVLSPGLRTRLREVADTLHGRTVRHHGPAGDGVGGIGGAAPLGSGAPEHPAISPDATARLGGTATHQPTNGMRATANDPDATAPLDGAALEHHLDGNRATPDKADATGRRSGGAARGDDGAGDGMVLLDGAAGGGRATIAAALSGGRPLLVAEVGGAGGLDAGEAGVLLGREAMLRGAAVYLTGLDSPGGAAVLGAMAGRGVVVLLGDGAQVVREKGLILERVILDGPGSLERGGLWDRALRGRSPGGLERIADLFPIGPGAIERAAARARRRAGRHGREPTEDDVRQAVREECGTGLDGLARRLPAGPGWERLVLPARTMREVRLVGAAVEQRWTVREAWGFGETQLGRGVTALFHGPSGTGKTFAARVLATELGLDLYRVDLSTVVSKYIGETERNLARIFAAARAAHAMVLFDEADALFGRRSAVQDARDRYANIEVAYLLQELEGYDGVALLATNLSGNLDDAFARRLGHAVEFPFPGPELREVLWRQAVPGRAPLAADVDFGALARLELAGGHIQSAVLAAACRAAAAGRAVGMPELVPAAGAELRKLHRMPDRADFGAYFSLLAEDL
ncbi:hypothetical protein GCM10010168_27220 [Actinoplanes ianthinogenes]|uniref:AAA+ ATPase domain-containing protein n=1 Tax=Actinoplanes ianthinogenes TaxID=122358 RepID=A0ABN6C2U0_9ACTN|nr:ATP-binding protein [Actinoplanes ianthinogenes]BCJ39862.1 hypothetical protein Aiant_05190 [Actinoplanes ianthinogenes]GGR08653.1 hypothetical protein GCM10010168_27220 [Actinoplanes ianthinogenes]